MSYGDEPNANFHPTITVLRAVPATAADYTTWEYLRWRLRVLFSAVKGEAR